MDDQERSFGSGAGLWSNKPRPLSPPSTHPQGPHCSDLRSLSPRSVAGCASGPQGPSAATGAKRFVYISAAVPLALSGVQVKEEVCRSIITMTVREQHPRSHH